MARKSASSSRNLIMETVFLVYIILMTSQQEEDGCNSMSMHTLVGNPLRVINCAILYLEDTMALSSHFPHFN